MLLKHALHAWQLTEQAVAENRCFILCSQGYSTFLKNTREQAIKLLFVQKRSNKTLTLARLVARLPDIFKGIVLAIFMSAEFSEMEWID